MNWIVKVDQKEEEKKQRIVVLFDPLAEKLHFYGECKVDNKSGDHKNGWVIFSHYINPMEISLTELQEKLEQAVVTMRTRLEEYENLDKGFSVLKNVGFEEDATDEDSQPE